ncbi:MAG: TlpA disulfide reductase family protein [Pyrinomonadaceae bacterium]
MKQILAFALILSFSAFAFASGDESAPMAEKEFTYKDWTFKNLQDGKDVNLRSFTAGKKLVLVVYFAAWCPNWRNEAPHVQKLYDKYKDKGFDVIAISEYASLDDTKKNITDNKFTFTVVTESELSEAKQKTTHYAYRQATGDTRNWGSPWNVFLEPAKLENKGETVSQKAFVVNGEIIETEVEAFIRQKLGLPAETKTTAQSLTKKVETCESTIELKKP